MNNINVVFENAKKAYKENLLIHSKKLERIEQEKKEKELLVAKKIENKESNIDYEKDCYSRELLELIKKFNFEIESYEKFFDFDEYDYAPVLERYYCKKNNWRFEIANISDCDIEEGIFSFSKIKHIITKEELNFYCDLGCRNTGEERLNTVLEFLEFESTEKYVSTKYSIYFELPELLRGKGYDVEEIDFSFKLNEPNGYLKLEENVFIKIYRAWCDDLKLVVTNDKKWDANSSNDGSSRRIGYYFNYTSSKDIPELIKCIESFKSHINGEIGFLMFGQYFKNSDIYNFFDNLRDKKDYYKECWNNYHIVVEHIDFWDARGYAENPLIVNKYTGLEIYTRTILKFNDAAQWSIGDNVNLSLITFIYDKRISNKCKLIIDNIICKSNDEVLYEIRYDNDDECGTGNTVIPEKHEKAIRLEYNGNFMELYEILSDYVFKMCKIHNINL